MLEFIDYEVSNFQESSTMPKTSVLQVFSKQTEADFPEIEDLEDDFFRFRVPDPYYPADQEGTNLFKI